MDLNADLGESFGAWRLGDDDALVEHITSANLACGFHAGDFRVMEATVALCRRAEVAVGAQPGYPDLLGFGRRPMPFEPDDVESLVRYQIGALEAFCRAQGVEMLHVKPHGALYNQAATDVALASAIARAVAKFSRGLALFGLPPRNRWPRRPPMRACASSRRPLPIDATCRTARSSRAASPDRSSPMLRRPPRRRWRSRRVGA